MTTVEQIITAALARNRKNQPGITATSAELLAAFCRVYPVFFTIAARVNPAYFGVREVLLEDSESDPEGWARPADAELVFRLEDADGVEVIVVPADERDADPTRPAVYGWGQVYYPAGQVLDPEPGTDELTVWFSKTPELPDSTADELDPLWPMQFDELLVLELALLLAHKDERMAEVGLLRADRDVWLRRFIAHLEHETLPIVRSTGTAQRFRDPSWTPLNLLLTGGTEVRL